MTAASISPESIVLQTDDGTAIAALRYPATGTVRGHLIMAGATGVPQLFYRNFAVYAASQGFTTLTLDYRGIGLSKPKNLRGYRMRLLDWARQDLGAAVDAMASDTLPLFMVGHSFGGHAFGLLPNHRKVAGFYTFATGAAWAGWMPARERIKVQFMWRVLGPLLVYMNGFLSWSQLGMGEDLPLGAYTDWKHWCSYPHYFFDDPAMGLEVQDLFDNVTTPIVAANAIDDAWAPPASRDAFMSGYRYTDLQTVDIVPAARGLASIGHMGYFRRAGQPLWEDALRWFGEHGPNTAKTVVVSAPAPSPSLA